MCREAPPPEAVSFIRGCPPPLNLPTLFDLVLPARGIGGSSQCHCFVTSGFLFVAARESKLGAAVGLGPWPTSC